MKKYHYVYYSYEEWGRGYIGSRATGIARANIYALIKNPNYTAKGFILISGDSA